MPKRKIGGVWHLGEYRGVISEHTEGASVTKKVRLNTEELNSAKDFEDMVADATAGHMQGLTWGERALGALTGRPPPSPP